MSFSCFVCASAWLLHNFGSVLDVTLGAIQGAVAVRALRVKGFNSKH